MLVKRFFYIFLFLGCLWGQIYCLGLRSVDDIELVYKDPIASFLSMKKNNLLKDGLSMNAFFLKWDTSSDILIKQIKNDLKIVKKEIRILKKKAKSYKKTTTFYHNLTDLYNYIKKYHLINDAVLFHHNLQKTWRQFFDHVACKQDIITLLTEKQIEPTGLEGLKVLLKMVEKDLAEVERYEDKLHSDFIDVKLANYVLKIELTRLRNAAIFHPLNKGTKLQSNYPR